MKDLKEYSKRKINAMLVLWFIGAVFGAAVVVVELVASLIVRDSYGMAATILLIYPKIRHWHPLQRGLLYGLSILTAEYATGSLLSALDVCPWSYEGCRFSVNGLIRLDFLPLWMMAGLLFERLLLQTNPDV